MSKKINKKKLKNNILILFVSILLIIVLIFLLFCKLFLNNKKIFKVESKENEIAEQKEKDEDGYETVGWIKVQNTDIDMPIVITEGNLDYPVEKERYIWDHLGDGKYHKSITLMGHNIFNLSASPKKSSSRFKRLEELMGFVYFDKAQESKYIQLSMDGKEYVYKIFAVNFVLAADLMYFPKENSSKEDMKSHIKYLRDSSLYNYDVNVNENDDILSLVTCTRIFRDEGNYDFAVTGRLVRENEKLVDYNVSINSSNYNKVKKILMKGDEVNEEEDSI